MGINVVDILSGGVLSFAGKLIDKIWPDPAERDKAKVALIELQQRGELAELQADLQLAMGQLEVNKVEAGGDFFRAGWRPAVGWICAFGLGYQIIARPLIAWASEAWWHVPVPPGLEMDTLLTLLFGMLGLGAYRTYEKVKAATNGSS